LGVGGLYLLPPLCSVWWFVSVGRVVLGRTRPGDPSSLGLKWRRRLWGCGRPSAGAPCRVFLGVGICSRGLHRLLAAAASVGCASGGCVYGGLGRGFWGYVESACFSSFIAFSSSSPHLMRPLRASTCFATSVVSLIISVVASSRVVYLELAMSGSGPWYW
jgi:hypothetical protein